MKDLRMLGSTKSPVAAINEMVFGRNLFKTKPLATKQITKGMRVLGDKFDLFQQLAEALKRR